LARAAAQAFLRGGPARGDTGAGTKQQVKKRPALEVAFEVVESAEKPKIDRTCGS
jgi:hypothetical protein